MKEAAIRRMPERPQHAATFVPAAISLPSLSAHETSLGREGVLWRASSREVVLPRGVRREGVMTGRN
eukprot:3982719-Prymnesium_polylepis.1